MAVITDSPVRNNGNLAITPAPDNAYKDQISNMVAIPNVIIVGLLLPCSANRAIPSPAPINRYQGAPNTMQTRWKNAAVAVNTEPTSK